MKKEFKQKVWFCAADGTKGSNKLVSIESGISSVTIVKFFESPEKVTSETAEKILDAIERLGYTPNVMPTMKMCNICKVVKPFEDFPYGHKAKKQRDKQNRKYLCSRCKDCDRARKRKYHKDNRDTIRKKQLSSKRYRIYNITDKEYEDMILAQNNLCAICQNPSHKTLHIDHDHITGRVRGLLCSNCNTGIGFLKEDIDNLTRAIAYLS